MGHLRELLLLASEKGLPRLAPCDSQRAMQESTCCSAPGLHFKKLSSGTMSYWADSITDHDELPALMCQCKGRPLLPEG
jgi:hypothetical protein